MEIVHVKNFKVFTCTQDRCCQYVGKMDKYDSRVIIDSLPSSRKDQGGRGPERILDFY